MQYLFDTNICIYLLQQRPLRVAERLAVMQRGSVGISVVSYAELCVGVERDAATRAGNQAALQLFITRIPVLPFDTEAAVVYGRHRAQLPERRRHAMDRLIAAHAVSRDLVLVTNNVADFVDYPDLKIENWAA